MSQKSRILFGVAAIALTLGAIPLAAGRDLAGDVFNRSPVPYRFPLRYPWARPRPGSTAPPRLTAPVAPYGPTSRCGRSRCSSTDLPIPRCWSAFPSPRRRARVPSRRPGPGPTSARSPASPSSACSPKSPSSSSPAAASPEPSARRCRRATNPLVIPGCAVRRRPGPDPWLWIPGSCFARPGMTSRVRARRIRRQGRIHFFSCDQLTRRANHQKSVQPFAQKYFASMFAQITFMSAAVPSHTEGRFAIVTDAGRDAVDALAL